MELTRIGEAAGQRQTLEDLRRREDSKAANNMVTPQEAKEKGIPWRVANTAAGHCVTKHGFPLETKRALHL